MQPWQDKSNSSTGQSSIQYDNNLSHLNKPQFEDGSHSKGKHSFRTHHNPIQPNDSSSFDITHNHAHMPLFTSQPSQFIQPDYISALDGGDVMNLLGSTHYSDHVYDDDLHSESMVYTSHRHQHDNQHALAEKSKLTEWSESFMMADDIISYLQKTEYTEDIYGIPVIGPLIKEAQEEMKTENGSRMAIDRLNMIRGHLLSKTKGNVQQAAKDAFQLDQNDWSYEFS
ncbi:hypothetical protein BDB01DRAFT_836970 [Pilobolus umbonatus]|nr:hypothetical protein BDB01DRAFT_836970 [Pilobolus umbonatus]